MSRSDPACSKQERPTNYTDSIGPGVFALTAPAASSRKHRVGELSMQFILFSIPRWVSMRFSERAPPLDRPEGGQNLLRYMTPNKTLLLTALCLFIFVRETWHSVRLNTSKLFPVKTVVPLLKETLRPVFTWIQMILPASFPQPMIFKPT